ncbi:MAG: Flp pilus assembly protein CpaB [Bdellovibrionota bacterium]
MNNKALTLSVVMAVLAIFFVQSYVGSIEEEAKKKFGTEILVISAKRDIKEMETLNETMLELTPRPKRFVEPAAIFTENEKDSAKTMKSLVGSVATVPIKKGEQLTYNKLTEPGARTGLSPQITPGKRAIAIPVNDVTGVARLVKPGDRVDLIAVLDKGGGKETKLAKVVLQDVVVLSTGKAVTNNVPRSVENEAFGGTKVKSLVEDTQFGSVTLEVDPSQAETMALIMSNGDNAITLALRNNDDTERVNVPAILLDDVLGPDSARVRAPAGKR